jgi:hypothetical protein
VTAYIRHNIIYKCISKRDLDCQTFSVSLDYLKTEVEVEVTLGPTVSRPVCLGVKPRLGPKIRFLLLSDSWDLLMWDALSDERTGLSFTIAVDPRQRSHSRFRVRRDSWSYSTVSDSRLAHHGGPGSLIYVPQEQGGPVIPPGTGFPFSSSPTTRITTAEIFESTSMRGLKTAFLLNNIYMSSSYLTGNTTSL